MDTRQEEGSITAEVQGEGSKCESWDGKMRRDSVDNDCNSRMKVENYLLRFLVLRDKNPT